MATPKLRAFRERALHRALLVVTAIGRRLPLSTAQRLGRALGSLAWHVARRERRKALSNLAIAFPEWPTAQRKTTARAMFRHLGTSVLELTWLPNLDPATRDRTTVSEGVEMMLERIDAGRSVIILTGHCGNWEWLSSATGSHGRPVSALQRERDQPEMNRYITELRAKTGVRTIDRGSPGSAREMIAAMRRPGVLAFVIDQNLRTESVKVPFFGRPAPTPIGPARLAVRSEAVVVPAFAQRLPDGRHLLRYLEPIECHRDDDPVALTAHITALIEAQIRRAPEQWVWMHDRWKERPKWEVNVTTEPSGDPARS